MRVVRVWPSAALGIAIVGCNALFGIDEATEIGSDASAGGSGASGGSGGTGGDVDSASGGDAGTGGLASGGTGGTTADGGGGSAGAGASGGTGGGAPCSGEICPFDKIQCCQSTNVSSALAAGNSITTEVCEADPFTCAVCRQGGGACSAYCQGVGSEFAVCLECIIENCSGLYLGVKAACGSACSDFDDCMAGCGS